MADIGFIGLGMMGAPMAVKLLKGRHTLFTPTRGHTPGSVIGACAKVCADRSEVERQVDVIITMVPDTLHIEDALFSENGVAAGLVKGKTVVDVSSLSPVAGNGDGRGTKVAKQIIVALTIEVVGVALLLAARAGADPAKVREALMVGFANSRILDVDGGRMVRRTFDPGFRIELHQTGMNLALTTGRQPPARRATAQHGDRPGAVQGLRRSRGWGRPGSLCDGAGAGIDGQLRIRTARPTCGAGGGRPHTPGRHQCVISP